jgi:23S rRNA A2030 N6-methylase RlmJ
MLQYADMLLHVVLNKLYHFLCRKEKNLRVLNLLNELATSQVQRVRANDQEIVQ